MARRTAPRNAQRRRSSVRPALAKAGTALAVGCVLFAAGIGIGAWVARPHQPGAAAAVTPTRPAHAAAVPAPQAEADIPLPRVAAPPPVEQPAVPLPSSPPVAVEPPAPKRTASVIPSAVAAPTSPSAPVSGQPPASWLSDPAGQRWKRFAAVAEPANGRPMIAIVLDDLGIDKRRGRRAIDLPAPVTLAFLPYATELAEQTASARARGHELLVHVPMQPHGPNTDPGPNVLDFDLGPDEVRRRIEWSLRQFEGFVGINNHMGSRFTENPEGMRLVGEAIRRHGLLFLDSMTSAKSVGEATVGGHGVPATSRDVFLDNVDLASEVEFRLAQTERVARETGSAIAIGHPRDATLGVLEAWIPRAKAAGFVLVPLTAVVEARATGTVRQARRQ